MNNNSLPLYLIDNGWKVYRKNLRNGEWKYEETTFENFSSTYSEGCVDYRFIKWGFEIIYGLHERNKPPTLIYPHYMTTNGDSLTNAIMDQYLNNKPVEEVYNDIMEAFNIHYKINLNNLNETIKVCRNHIGNLVWEKTVI